MASPADPHPVPASQSPSAYPLAALGARNDVIAALTSLEPSGRPARVVRVDRDRVAVEDDREHLRTDPERSHITEPETGETSLPAVGDWVVISRTEPPAILALGPRSGRLVRRDPGDPRPQILAAGVEVVIITVPLDRPANISRLERELVTAFDAPALPVVALTKADLATDFGDFIAALQPAVEDVDTVAVSALDPSDPGVHRLLEIVRSHGTGVLLGPSGAGKSTLMNAMIGAPVRTTGDVRDGDSRGRHVTATRALLPLPGGGALIDTPGLRALGLWDAEQGLNLTFSEISERAADCKFLDCVHDEEPSCAVRAAVGDGTIDAGRFERFKNLYAELVAAEHDRALAERHRRRRADRHGMPSRGGGT